MKPLALLLFLMAGLVSCDQDFGKPCEGCLPPDAHDVRSSILLNVRVFIPPGLYTEEQATQVVDVADLKLLDPITRNVVARKQVSIKGNGSVVDSLYAASNTVALYSSEVKFEASWGVYIISFHAQRIPDLTSEKVIDCSSGSVSIRFDY